MCLAGVVASWSLTQEVASPFTVMTNNEFSETLLIEYTLR